MGYGKTKFVVVDYYKFWLGLFAGAWGTVPQSTVDGLIALGLNLDQTVAALGKVDDILSTANYGIYSQRHANTPPRRAPPCHAGRRQRHEHAPCAKGTRP